MSEVDFEAIAISCARRGMAMAEAAAVFGLPPTTFRGRCARRGIKWPDHYGRDVADRDAEVRRAARSGMTKRAAAEMLGVSLSLLVWYCNRKQIKFQRPRSRDFRLQSTFEVPPPPTGLLEDAKRFLRRRGNVVFDARVEGGPAGMIRFNSRTVSPAGLIEIAERLGFTPQEGAHHD
mgnify:CR=1 FL=1